MNSKPTLQRTIGVWGLSANIINIIVGAGIFVLPAIIAEGLGAASITAYLFCGLLVALVMLCFAEVGSQITHSGGAYAYVEVAFGRYFGFLTANLFVCSCIAADAAVANALITILVGVYPLFSQAVIQALFFLILFGGLAGLNVFGVNQGVKLVKITTIAKLIPLILLVIFGWSEVTSINLLWEKTPSFEAIGEVSLILFFAFQGAETGLTIGGEVSQPQKTIPKAIFISITSVLVLYIGLQFVAQGILGADLVLFKENPLAQTAAIIFGPIGMTLITIGAAISMFGNVSGEVLSMPRVLYGAAKDNVIVPQLIARIHPRYNTPYVAIILYALLGFLLATFGGFKTLAILSSAAILLIYLGVALAAIKLRRMNNQKIPFKIPMGITVPILACGVIIWFLSHLSLPETKGIAFLIGVLSILFALLNFLKNKR